ncbi:hypothetical protein [Sphingomonas oryzagri]|uniref:Uncharacterized protein n=1 Tax=Sphingomonas oryzagri TaxID=3042314 RepID=A0ABT6N3M7_9SPHN|nr:hypothetical protein [Sphingomonas oryzagri]MDH7638976.1 hypothetical protein [Sphingomonas oryzagri]
MSNTDIAGIVAKLTGADLLPFVYAAAIEWCGEKERETFPSDIQYFMHNWWEFPSFKSRVERLAVRAALQEAGDA